METRQKIVLGIGAVVSVVVVYLIWKHEQSITAAQQDATNVDASNTYAQNAAMAAFTNFQSQPLTGATFDLHAGDSVVPPVTNQQSDPMLRDLLTAFFGSNATNTTNTNNTTNNTIAPIDTNHPLPVHAVGPERTGTMHGIAVNTSLPVVHPIPPSTGIQGTVSATPVTRVVGRATPIRSPRAVSMDVLQ